VVGTGLQISVATTCPDSTAEIGRYRLIALPYSENGQVSKVRLLENKPVWFKNAMKPIQGRLNCSESSSGLVCLSSKEDSSGYVKGRVSRAYVPPVAHESVGYNQYLVSAQEKVEGSLICNEQVNNISLNGIYSVKLPSDCSFKLIMKDKVQELFPTKAYFPTTAETKELPQLLPVQDEDVAPVKFTSIMSEYPYESLWEFFRTYYLYCLYTLGAVGAAGVFCFIAWEASARLRTIRSATRGLNEQTRKRVYIRNPLLR
jgi:hypothetical protein